MTPHLSLRSDVVRLLSVLVNKKLTTILRYLVFLGLGVFLAWLSLKGINNEEKTQIKTALSHARYWLIAPMFIIFMLSHLARALRWRLLINSLGYYPKTENTFFAVMVGYLTNMAVPRLGEVLKCTLLAKYENMPIDKLLGTIILERIVDALSLLLILAITLAVQLNIYSDLINAFFHSHNATSPKPISGFLISVILIGFIILSIFLWMLVRRKNFLEVMALLKKIVLSVW